MLGYALIESRTGLVPTGVYSTRPNPPIRLPLPERGPDDQVSLRVAVENDSGVVCVRVYNETETVIRYDGGC